MSFIAHSNAAAATEQMQKGVTTKPNFPTCSDATELNGFLTRIVKEISKVAVDPDLMCAWVREVTKTAVVSTAESYEEWFTHLSDSGKGFVRIDNLLLQHVTSATKLPPGRGASGWHRGLPSQR